MTGMTWETSIAEVQGDDVIIRGHRLDELIGKRSYVEMIFLLLRGDFPTENEVAMLNALMVMLSDHGISPSSTIARILASTGTPMQASISGAMLSIADWHGGSGEALGQLLVALVDGDPDELRDRCARHVAESRAIKREVPGFGHPQHPDGDPRAGRLLAMAADLGLAGTYCAALAVLGDELGAATKPSLRVPNVTGALAAILLDLGFPWEATRGMVIASRVVGLTAHVVEELHQGNRWRHSPSSDVTYTGPRPE